MNNNIDTTFMQSFVNRICLKTELEVKPSLFSEMNGEIREANKIKFDILSKKLPSTRMVYSDTTGIRDRMNWHVNMLTSFEKALGNKSLADEKITEECLLIVKNYKFHLKKLSGMVATLSGSRLGDNMGEIALHGGVVTSAMDTLFQPSY